ncbi:hypothetical protein Scep_023857 [Stephania cephalantha]|uniref:Uncharacterized protein n=1 Tax=Stephania cephalantha TaxID=152367 RepID=A0AAP0F0X1_9MAGN
MLVSLPRDERRRCLAPPAPMQCHAAAGRATAPATADLAVRDLGPRREPPCPPLERPLLAPLLAATAGSLSATVGAATPPALLVRVRLALTATKYSCDTSHMGNQVPYQLNLPVVVTHALRGRSQYESP